MEERNAMNAKKRKQLIVLLVLLAAAVLILLAVLLGNRAAAKQEENNIIHVTTVENPSTLTLTRGTERNTFFSGDDGWTWQEDADFPVDSSKLDSITSLLSGLTASREFEIEDSLTDYGLETPENVIEVSNDNGESAALLLGGTSGDNYYCMLEGGEVIYLIDSSLYDLLPETLTDLATLAEYPKLTSEMTKNVTINGDFDQSFTVKEVEVDSEDGDSSDSSASEPATEYHWFLSGDVDVTENSLMTSLRTEINSLELSSLAAFKPTEKELTACGMDTPTAILTVEYEEDGQTKTSALTIGSYDENEDAYYCILDGDTTMLYLADASALDNTVNIAQQGYAAAQAESAGENTED